MAKKDDMSNIPASVLKQQEDAKKRMELAKKEGAGQTQEPEPAPVVVQKQEPPATETPAPVTPVTPVTPPVTPPAIGESPDGWEHKYRVLQGKYNKEVEGMKATVLDLKSVVERQSRVIDELNAKANAAPAAAASQNTDLEDLSPDAYEGWGDEMKVLVKSVNSQKNLIRQQAEVIAQLQAQLKSGRTAPAGGPDPELKSRLEMLESEANENRIAAYYKCLEDNIGSQKGIWRQINVSQGFSQWLDQEDPLTLRPRRDHLNEAAQNFRGKQVASIFNDYLRSNSAGADVRVAEEVPGASGFGSSGENASDANKAGQLTLEDFKKAQNDFIQGRITEEEFNKVSHKYQTQLRGRR